MYVKRWVKLWFVFGFIFIFLIGLFNYIVDPLQLYRKATFYKPYSYSERYMVWGLIKNYDYNSILVGSSMTENFTYNDINENLKLNILRIPFSGLSAYEANLLIQKALESNTNLSTILYGLDLFSFRGEKTRLRFGENSLPTYLINDTIVDDYKYLLNIDTLKYNIKIFLSNFLGWKKDNIDFNRMWNWNNKYKFNKELCIKSYKESLKTNEKKDEYKIEKLKESFNYNILPHLKNEKIKFIIFFPPYSILAWKSWEQKKYLKDLLNFKEYILKELVKYKNIKIYDFQIAKEITHNLDNYKDLTHYSEDINKWMIQQIKNNKYLVTKDNIDQYLKMLNKQIKNYNLKQVLLPKNN